MGWRCILQVELTRLDYEPEVGGDDKGKVQNDSQIVSLSNWLQGDALYYHRKELGAEGW